MIIFDYIRSFIFNIMLYVVGVFWIGVTFITLFLPRSVALIPQRMWSWTTQYVIRFIGGIKSDIRGIENLPDGPFILACKHQSAWETTIFQGMFKDPAMVLKKELMGVPIFGWHLRKVGMIAVDRADGTKAMIKMLRQAKAAVEAGRPLIIFPEGTRVSTEDDANYQAGVYGLYGTLKIPVVPAALNSGYFWPRRKFIKKTGTVVLEFLPAIAPGLKKDAFMEQLTNSIEPATQKLLAEAKGGKHI